MKTIYRFKFNAILARRTYNFIDNMQLITKVRDYNLFDDRDEYYPDIYFSLGGKYHRIGGPGIIFNFKSEKKTTRIWFLNGISYEGKNYWKMLDENNIQNK